MGFLLKHKQMKWLPTIFVVTFFAALSAQVEEKQKIAGFMFYNLENLFDVTKDSVNLDEEFTPSGARRWNFARLKQKWRNTARVITNAGGWNLPVVVGVCEVENRWVLTSMLSETGLNHLSYDVVHYDSPDARGIDVALLYKKDRVSILESKPIPVTFDDGSRPTRDILFAKILLESIDTIFIMVNHWPSRFGGAAATQLKRKKAALIVKEVCDSLYNENQKSKILIMGDFNEPHTSDVFLKDLDVGRTSEDKWLISPALDLPAGVGTLKYQHSWDLFDQIIVSRPVLSDTVGYRMSEPHLKIIKLPFLLQRDETFGGEKLFRTYEGFKYLGGYSDHLPVWVELNLP